jgi:hypothetical protein
MQIRRRIERLVTLRLEVKMVIVGNKSRQPFKHGLQSETVLLSDFRLLNIRRWDDLLGAGRQ